MTEKEVDDLMKLIHPNSEDSYYFRNDVKVRKGARENIDHEMVKKAINNFKYTAKELRTMSRENK